jgi:saccharopine dehydrogenase-like NADP-dependent oxidoreductase
MEGGQVVVRPALTEIEALDFDGVGTLEAFNTDGLRTLLNTSKVPDMLEKTLRYPGHCEQMAMLRDTGFFDEVPIAVDGVAVRPVDLTAELLIPAWRLGRGEEDLTVLRVEVEGLLEGERLVRRWDLIDRYDRTTGTTSMARTTGYTCTAMVHAVAEGLFTEVGLWAPEIVGRDAACHGFIFDYLADRGIRFDLTEITL